LSPAPAEKPINAKETITQILVSNLEKSKEWYTRLFGKPPDLEPFPGNVEFKIAGAWLQINQGEVKPSSWTMLFEVRDLKRERERLRRGKVAATEIESSPGVIAWFDLSDPDGNKMRWFQVLTEDEKVTGKHGS
jgi:predicted enzyme related to lactoylglutathione lyase